MQVLRRAITFIGLDTAKSVLFFMPWWYGSGRGKIQKALLSAAKDLIRNLNLGTLRKYLFAPMYGYTDFASRAISIVVRIVQFVVLSFAAFVYMLFLVLVLIAWLLFPIFILYNIAFQIGIIQFNFYEILWG
ncbi:MAG: hypothetical protein Q8P90_03680 [bacterium]|nr:hypothetical protein [bacterium]